MARKSDKNKVDYLDPNAKNPDVEKAKKKAFDVGKKLLKKVGQAIKKIVSSIVKILVSNPIGWIVLVVLLLVVIVLAFEAMPGAMKDKLKQFFADILKDFTGWFVTSASNQIKNEDIANLANYIEEMGYDLVGYGFVKPDMENFKEKATYEELINNDAYDYRTEEVQSYDNNGHEKKDIIGKFYHKDTDNVVDIEYYNSLGKLIDNNTGNLVVEDENNKKQYTDRYGILRSTEETNSSSGYGKIKIEDDDQINTMYRLLRTYILSDYRIYTLKNDDETILKDIYQNLAQFFGGSYQDAWSRGMVKLYNATNGISTSTLNFWDKLGGDGASIDREKLRIKNGWFNREMIFNINGWAPRYGMSLEFLLSLHLGTMAPDLVYAMLQNFDTEIQVYLNDSGASKVTSAYIERDRNGETNQDVTLSDGGVSLRSIKRALKDTGHPIIAGNIDIGDYSILEWLGTVTLTRKAAQDLFEENIGLSSPYNCTYKASDHELLYSTKDYAQSRFETVAERLEGHKMDTDANDYLEYMYGYTDEYLQDLSYEVHHSADDVAYYNSATALFSLRNDYYYGEQLTPELVAEHLGDVDIYGDRDKAKNIAKNYGLDVNNSEIFIKPGIEHIPEYSCEFSGGTTDLYRLDIDREDAEWEVYIKLDEDGNVEKDSSGNPTIITEEEYLEIENEEEEKLYEECTLNYNSYIYDVYKTGYVENGKKIHYGDVIGTETEEIVPQSLLDKYSGCSCIGKFKCKRIKDIEHPSTDSYDDNPSAFEDYYVYIFYNPYSDGRAGKEYDQFNYFIVVGEDGTLACATSDGVNQLESGGSAWENYQLYWDEDQDHYLWVQISAVDGTNGEQLYLQTSTINRYNIWVYDEPEYHVDSSEKLFMSKSNGLANVNHELTTTIPGEFLCDRLYANITVREKTQTELVNCGILIPDPNDPNGFIRDPDAGYCSEEDLRKCCKNCKDYVKKVIKSLQNVSDQGYKLYTPYIARVVGSWFRNTYFIIPDSKDEAIKDYAGSIITFEDNSTLSVEHPEFNASEAYGRNGQYVKVDEEYLSDTGEYWTAYEMNDDGDYQLYVLKPNGLTSNTTMESFLEDGKIDGVQGTIHGKEVTGYDSKELAEADGWAFVKKAQTNSLDQLINTSNTSGYLSNEILWSAYSFDDSRKELKWDRVLESDDNKKVNNVYNIIYYDAEEKKERKNEETGVFFKITQTNSVSQEEDAVRGETNPLVKYLFKYRKFYIYDGSGKTAETIEHDKIRVLYGYNYYTENDYDKTGSYYKDKELVDKNQFKDANLILSDNSGNFYHNKGLLGDSLGTTGLLSDIYGKDWADSVRNLLNRYGRSALRQAYGTLTISSLDEFTAKELAEQWLEWQLDMFYMDKYGVNLYQYYKTDQDEVETVIGDYIDTVVVDLLVLKYDPRDPDLISTVNITKTSLNAFSILENVESLDAEYQYRDFKELIVELDYFDKEDLSDKIPEIFTWILPETSAAGWPVRPIDKQELDYGTLIQSKSTYDGIKAFIADKNAESESEASDSAQVEQPKTMVTSGSTIREDKIFWIGDSWIVNLGRIEIPGMSPNDGLTSSDVGTNDAILSGYFYSVIGQQATYMRNHKTEINIPLDASAIVVNLGLNNPKGNITAMKNFIIDLKSMSNGKTIFVMKTPHVGKNYTYKDNGIVKETADSYNLKIDEYNEAIESYCDGVQVIWLDATKNITDSEGYLSNDVKNGEYHLKSSATMNWYADIISLIRSGTYGSGSFEYKDFEGYVADQAVVSPVTGKVLEYGKHNRTNIYTGQQENVGYIKIQIMDTEDYFIDRANSLEDAKNLNYFYEEYKNVCEGYTIMIDGFDVDLNIDGGEYNKDENIMALYNSEMYNKRLEIEQAKEDAPYILLKGGYTQGSLPSTYKANDIDGLEGIYIKEGKYLGKTVEHDAVEIVESNLTENMTEDEQEEAMASANYSGYVGTVDYMRIIMMDRDYSTVENVEKYFDVPDGIEQTSGSGNLDINLITLLIDCWENANVMDYILGIETEYKTGRWQAANYITQDKVYFINFTDKDDASTRNYGPGICHQAHAIEKPDEYYHIEEYKSVGVDITHGHHELNTKCEVEKVLKVQQMLIQDTFIASVDGYLERAGITLEQHQKDALVDIAYQYGPGNEIPKFINAYKSGTVEDYFTNGRTTDRWKNRWHLYQTGEYLDRNGNDIKAKLQELGGSL